MHSWQQNGYLIKIKYKPKTMCANRTDLSNQTEALESMKHPLDKSGSISIAQYKQREAGVWNLKKNAHFLFLVFCVQRKKV